MTDRDQIRREAETARYWTSPELTARHYARHCLALLTELEQAEAKLAKVPALVEAGKTLRKYIRATGYMITEWDEALAAWEAEWLCDMTHPGQKCGETE
jgi:hypothetical protein